MPVDVYSLIEPIADRIYDIIKKNAKNERKLLRVNKQNVEEALSSHIQKVNTITSEISFKELNLPKSLFAIYVPLDLTLNSLNTNGQNDIITKDIASNIVENVINHSANNIVLVGTPGSGKTTTIKYFCQKLLTDGAFLPKINFPILIRLKEDELVSNPSIPVFNYIFNLFGLIIENSIKCTNLMDDRRQLDLFIRPAVLKILNEFHPLIILDGFDEITDDNIKQKVLNDINEISLSAKGTRFILTTRKGEDRFHLDNTRFFEILPLNDDQIRTFAEKWLPSKWNDFLTQLRNSPVYDTAKRPLTLSHLCAIYEREGSIPEKPRSIYRKIVNLLILEWNVQNQINRPSKFQGFDPDRKKEFLENLAYELTIFFNKNQFSKNDLERSYGNLYMKFNLPYTQMPEVINEIQIHNGLITQSSYDKFEFAHKSFQEYLAAEHIVKLPKLPLDQTLNKYPAEMALAITLSSEPSEYFAYFINDYLLNQPVTLDFWTALITRLCIEKPDFVECKNLAIAIIYLQDYYLREILKENPDVEKIRILDNCFKNLDEFNSISQSMICLTNIYIPYVFVYDHLKLEILELNLVEKTRKSIFKEPLIVTNKFFELFLKGVVLDPIYR